ncbi:MAG TPA: AAA family ATPase [Kofleriaceae bacterium]
MIRAIVTIDGIDGSGKSTFARRIASAFETAGIASGIVRVDDFRREVVWGKGDSEADVYYADYYDLVSCERVLRTFLDGGPALDLPAWDMATERISGTRNVDLRAVNVVVVEGVFPRRLPSAARGLGIYLTASEEEARRRILERDQKKGRTAEEVQRRIDHRYFPTQRRYHEQFSPQEHADVLIDNEQPRAPRIIAQDLRRLHPDLRPILDGALRVTTV